tara:strand:- start:175 stop:807 length:633 start_codon:yes stop_codon:yes gene_type:complete
MANTAKKTAKTSTATKTNTKVVNIKTTTKERKAKTEKPDLTSLNGPLFSTVISNTEKLAENAKTGLSYWKAIGDNLIEIRKNWIAAGGDIKARGEASFRTYRETSSIGFMSKQDVSDAILIAQNWSVVSKMDDTDSLDSMGVSKCKKAIKEAQKKTPKQGPATSGNSKKTETVSAQSIVDNALATAAKHNIKIADVLLTLKNTLEKTAKK